MLTQRASAQMLSCHAIALLDSPLYYLSRRALSVLPSRCGLCSTIYGKLFLTIGGEKREKSDISDEGSSVCQKERCVLPKYVEADVRLYGC